MFRPQSSNLMITAKILAITSILLLFAGVFPSAAFSGHSSLDAATCLKGKWTDNLGNNFKFSATCSNHYKITGKISSSSYLANTPWKVKGTGSGSKFTFTATDPDPNNGYCSLRYKGTITATPSEMASGTWQYLPTGNNPDCTGSGTFTMSQTS
jgi:hypothetical protein